MAQGKKEILMFIFPDRENTEDLAKNTVTVVLRVCWWLFSCQKYTRKKLRTRGNDEESTGNVILMTVATLNRY